MNIERASNHGTNHADLLVTIKVDFGSYDAHRSNRVALNAPALGQVFVEAGAPPSATTRPDSPLPLPIPTEALALHRRMSPCR